MPGSLAQLGCVDLASAAPVRHDDEQAIAGVGKRCWSSELDHPGTAMVSAGMARDRARRGPAQMPLLRSCGGVAMRCWFHLRGWDIVLATGGRKVKVGRISALTGAGVTVAAVPIGAKARRRRRPTPVCARMISSAPATLPSSPMKTGAPTAEWGWWAGGGGRSSHGCQCHHPRETLCWHNRRGRGVPRGTPLPLRLCQCLGLEVPAVGVRSLFWFRWVVLSCRTNGRSGRTKRTGVGSLHPVPVQVDRDRRNRLLRLENETTTFSGMTVTLPAGQTATVIMNPVS